MGSIDIKLLLAEEVQLPLSKIEPVIKQAINLYNNTTIKTNKQKKPPQKISNLLHTINPEAYKANTSSLK